MCEKNKLKRNIEKVKWVFYRLYGLLKKKT